MFFQLAEITNQLVEFQTPRTRTSRVARNGWFLPSLGQIPELNKICNLF